jgi:glycosyltransferase involved in cell wall biosynthesis
MFVYPSIWEETSCISAIESMAAGLYTIVTNLGALAETCVTNLGALAETCSEFGIYVPYDNNHRRLAFKFAQAIKQGAEAITLKPIQDHLKRQRLA